MRRGHDDLASVSLVRNASSQDAVSVVECVCL